MDITGNVGKETVFNRVVLAGGGCRSIWQAGFWHVAGTPLGLDNAIIGCVSAGAAMACLIRANRIIEGLSVFKKNFQQNSRNIYPGRLGTRHPVFPQYSMYRQGLLAVLDEAAIERMNRSADIRVLIAKPPLHLNLYISIILGISAYTLEKHLQKPMHPTWAQKLGFQPLVVAVENCANAGQLADLVLQSSCMPPFVPVLFRDKHPVLDGGLIDNVPIVTVMDVKGPILVLLSRRYPRDRIPAVNGRLYVQPSQPPPIRRWDYTNPEGLQETFDLGRRDAEVFLKEFEEGQYDDSIL